MNTEMGRRGSTTGTAGGWQKRRNCCWRHRRRGSRLEPIPTLSLGEKRVDQDGADRIDLLVRLEVKQDVGDGPPHAHRLVGLAGVGGDDVLEDRLVGLGHVGVGDGDEIVVHGSSFRSTAPRPRRLPGLPAPILFSVFGCSMRPIADEVLQWILEEWYNSGP